MSKRTQSTAFILLAGCALLGSVAASTAGAQTGEKPEVIVLTVRLPGNAILLIDDHKTQLTGDERIFRTPPLPAGKHYSYILKATSGGKEVTRKIHLAHGADNTFDMRAEFLPAATDRIHPKQFTSTDGNEMRGLLAVAIWGASRQTVEQAFDKQPADGSKYPK
jgi:uncharacterized protein (TIGR03000 family)